MPFSMSSLQMSASTVFDISANESDTGLKGLCTGTESMLHEQYFYPFFAAHFIYFFFVLIY